MGTVIDLRDRRKTPAGDSARRFVRCEHCRERHPVVRLPDGTQRCPTAFTDDGHWFCRNRGCRAAWLTKRAPRR